MIRRFLEFAIDKPLLNHMFLVFIMILSIFAYINIPKEIFPPMAMDKIFISGGYVGTSADVFGIFSSEGSTAFLSPSFFRKRDFAGIRNFIPNTTGRTPRGDGSKMRKSGKKNKESG